MNNTFNRKTLITGATGFVGSALYAKLLADGPSPIAALRKPVKGFCNSVIVGDIDANTNWTDALKGIDVIVHCAARVHILNDNSANPLKDFRKINVDGTLNLARAAAKKNVKRFIFLSTIKVNGETSTPNKPFTPEDQPSPVDPYAISKLEAELGLMQIAQEYKMEVVILRPPLIYGPNVKANFLEMMRWLNKSIPLPLGLIHNKRSLLAIDNLIDLIHKCLYHPAAANQIFLVSDDHDVSTTELLTDIAKALNVQAKLLPIPPIWLKLGLTIIGKKSIYQRLASSLQADISKTKNTLEWEPPLSFDQSLRIAAKNFLK